MTWLMATLLRVAVPVLGGVDALAPTLGDEGAAPSAAEKAAVRVEVRLARAATG